MSKHMLCAEPLVGVQDLPWGHNLATDVAIAHSRDLTGSQQAIIANYRDSAAQVQYSDPDITLRVNARFSETDGEAASRDLAPDLESPIEPHNVLGWIANRATDNDIATLADWNVDRTATLATRLHQVTNVLGEMIIQRATQLADNGVLPVHAPKTYDQSLAQYTKWTAFDSFNAGLKNYHGYCTENTVALTNLFDDRTHMSDVGELLSAIAFHEATHGVGFTTGGSTSLDDDTRLRTVEEAFAQHCAEASGDHARQPYVVEPKRRVNNMGIYAEYRSNLAELTDLENGGVPLSTIGAVLMSPHDSAQRQVAKQQIVQRLDALADTSQPQRLLAA